MRATLAVLLVLALSVAAQYPQGGGGGTVLGEILTVRGGGSTPAGGERQGSAGALICGRNGNTAGCRSYHT